MIFERCEDKYKNGVCAMCRMAVDIITCAHGVWLFSRVQNSRTIAQVA